MNSNKQQTMTNNKQQTAVKLYTEEDVRQMLKNTDLFDDWDIEFQIRYLTPIQLPSDEEIVNKALEIKWSNTLFKDGAKFVIDKIQGGNNDKQ
jgi:hypothetical protein